jgi:hypothetical protein
MVRRAVLVTAAAVALILAPTAAVAYAPASLSVPRAQQTPPAGVPFTVVASGAKANEAVTLTMTPDPASIGTRSLTRTANAHGEVSFVVTLTTDGTYVLTSRSASGAVLGTQTVTVVQNGAVIVAGASAPAGKPATAPAGKPATPPAGTPATAGTTATAAAGQLAFTGWHGDGLGVGGVALLVSGTALVLLTRRRTLT